MAPNGNTRWPHTALLTRSTSGPERQYRWPPKAQILTIPYVVSVVVTEHSCLPRRHRGWIGAIFCQSTPEIPICWVFARADETPRNRWVARQPEGSKRCRVRGPPHLSANPQRASFTGTSRPRVALSRRGGVSVGGPALGNNSPAPPTLQYSTSLAKFETLVALG